MVRTMTSWRQVLLTAGLEAERHYDALKRGLYERLERNKPIKIVAYRT